MKKYVIWGAGDYCREALSTYQELLNDVLQIVDVDPLKWGECYIFGFSVLPVQEINRNAKAILVAVKDRSVYEDVCVWVREELPAIPCYWLADFIKEKGWRISEFDFAICRKVDALPINIIREHMQDEESRIIYGGRINASRSNNMGIFYNTLLKLNRNNGTFPISEPYRTLVEHDRITIIQKYLNGEIDHKGHPLILVGIEDECYGMLMATGLRPDYFLRRDRGIAEFGLDIPEISLSECSERFREAYYISGENCDGEIHQTLRKMGIEDRYFLKRHTCWKSQYFDEEFLKPQKNGVFVDAGVLDLNNTFDYIRWCNGDFEKIYALEPDKKCYKDCKERLAKETDSKLNDKVTLYNAAAWSRDGRISLDEYGTAKKVSVVSRSIDSILDGGKVTYIKMDIEGAELEALKGAAKSIRKWKPQMAICLYHKRQDVYELPLYILSLVPDYKFYVRHYSTCLAETVLYCL